MLYQGPPIGTEAEKRPEARLDHPWRPTLRIILLLAVLVTVLSYWLKDRLPPPGDIHPALRVEPLQIQQSIPPPITVQVKGIPYLITPLYRYDIRGLVVSYHHSDSFLDISHKKWNDYLNIKDLCVIWGRNVQSGFYRKLKFSSGDWTCYYSYNDPAIGAQFCSECLSNNHVLCTDPQLARRIRKVRRGDQIHMSGFLSKYSIPGRGFERGTSTTRDDTGDGACETIFVTGFTILSQANALWTYLFKAGIILIILSGILMLFI